jgi:hypothetical protein
MLADESRWSVGPARVIRDWYDAREEYLITAIRAELGIDSKRPEPST